MFQFAYGLKNDYIIPLITDRSSSIIKYFPAETLKIEAIVGDCNSISF